MLRKFLPLQKTFIQNSLCKPMAYNFSALQDEMKVKMNLYLSETVTRQFIINESLSLDELQELLKNEDQKIKTVQFKYNNEQVEQTDMNFLDLALNNHIDIIINNQNHAFDIDLEGNAAYFNNTKYDNVFAKNEVPILDAEVLNNFINLYNEQIDKKYPGQQSYTGQEVQQAVLDTLEVFGERNQPVNIQAKVNIYQNLLKQLEEQQQKLQQLETEAQGKSKNFIKMILFLNIVQGAVLFYMTYFLWGWDVVEPISYLLALSIETFILFYFIRQGKGLSLQRLFQNKYGVKRAEVLRQKKSTNADKQMQFLKNKIEHLQSKITYG